MRTLDVSAETGPGVVVDHFRSDLALPPEGRHAVINSRSLAPFNDHRLVRSLISTVFDERLTHYRNAAVTSLGFHRDDTGALVVDHGTTPQYIHDMIRPTPPAADQVRRLESGATTRRVERAAVFLHAHYRVFGHFLTECFPRLSLLASCQPEVPLVIPTDRPSWLDDFLDTTYPELGRLEVGPDEVLAVDELLIPGTPIVGLTSLETLADLRDRAERLGGSAATPQRLFVTRRHVSAHSYRQLLNERDLERIAQNLGFEAIAPERLSAAEQIRLFFGAEHVVGEFGSGMHMALFAQPGTNVMVINWIVAVQQAIAAAAGHHITFLLGDSMEPVSFEMNAARKRYTADEALFEATLAELVGG